jgi:general stress protein YciG
MASTNPGNFANRPKEEVREIASKGGQASSGNSNSGSNTSGTSSANTNPGNFANRPKEEVQEIASKGGQASHNSGFASMDPDKQVSLTSVTHTRPL